MPNLIVVQGRTEGPTVSMITLSMDSTFQGEPLVGGIFLKYCVFPGPTL